MGWTFWTLSNLQSSLDGPLSYWLRLTNFPPDIPSLVVVFHTSFNDISLQVFSSLTRVLLSRTVKLLFWKAKQGQGRRILGSQVRDVCWVCSRLLIFPYFQHKQWWHFLSLKWQFAYLIALLCRLGIFSSTFFALISVLFQLYFLADNSHFISIKLCLFMAICCCNLLGLSA